MINEQIKQSIDSVIYGQRDMTPKELEEYVDGKNEYLDIERLYKDIIYDFIEGEDIEELFEYCNNEDQFYLINVEVAEKWRMFINNEVDCCYVYINGQKQYILHYIID
jgi:predicted membrane-bound dolichyl-phosphate-mannose-protein mannosyltransferase